MVFVWFWNGNNCSPFPNVWYCVGVKCDVVNICEVSDGKRTQVFEVSDVNAIWSSGVVVCAV